MKIAVTYESGNVFQHFGHCPQFKFYTVEDGNIVKEEIISTNGSGHGALAGFLRLNGATTLICGGIGGGARQALAQLGITLFPGVTGNADESVKALLKGALNFNPNFVCNHHGHDHDHGHDCGSHKCGEDKHGCGGNH